MKKLLLLLPIWLFAVVSSDEPYFVHSEKNLQIIYPKSLENEAKSLLIRADQLMEIYQKEYRYTPKKPLYINLASYKNQIANAYATAIPHNIVGVFGAGGLEIDYFGYQSWIDLILAHELAHIYQLDNKKEPSATLEKVLGKNHLPLITPVPIFTFANIFLPDFLLEGNALYNESRITKNGRLFTARSKALVGALISDQMSSARIINNHRDFPFLEEKYIIGGFFQAFLARRFGADQANSFFATNSSRWINPLLLDKGFQEHFGAGFYELWDQFVADQSSKSFVKQQGKTVAKSLTFAPISSDKNSIYIYVSDQESASKIVKIDKKSEKTSDIKGRFLAGKPFCFVNFCTTRASGYTATEKIEAGLFDADQKPVKRFASQIVQDFYGEKYLYFDTQKSYDEASLYENSRFIDQVDSGAFYNQKGEICYTKVDKDRRKFICDGKEIFALKSHFLIADQLPNGAVLFTASTPNGSGLFIFQNGKISQLGDGDNVLGAKWLHSDQFLLQTVNQDGYEYKISSLSLQEKRPVKEIFGFENEQFLTPSKKEIALKTKPYNHLAMLKFSSLYPMIYFDNGVAKGAITASFVDPLEQNMLQIGYMHEDDTKVFASYHNEKYRLYFGASYFAELNATKNSYERDFASDTYLGYKIFGSNTKRVDAEIHKLFDPDDKLNEPFVAKLKFDYAHKLPLAYKPKTAFGVEIDAKTNDREGINERAKGGKIYASRELVKRLWIDLEAKYSEADQGYIFLKKAPVDIDDPLDFVMQNNYYNYGSKKIEGYKISATTAIKTHIYFSSFPFGLHRVAPKAEYQKLYLGKSRFEIDESVYSLDFEMLFAHRFDFAVEAKYAQNSDNEKDRFLFLIKAVY